MININTSKIISSQKFSRFEMKYILNEKSKNIQKEIKNFMIYDGFTNLDNYYFVRSLYFDNRLIQILTKVDGVRSRHKFRIRTYSKQPNTPIFLEMKGRENSRTYKLRQEIKPEYLNLFYKKKNYFELKKNLSK